MLFNEKLKMLRKGSNLTQEELAEKINVSRQAITKWECDEGYPDIENLKQLSKLFNVSIDELIKEEKNVEVNNTFTREIDIDHIKHFDIVISKIYELNIKPCDEEKVKIEVLSNSLEDLGELFKIKFDDLYNRLDISVKSKTDTSDVSINLYLPLKYTDEIELKSKMKCLNIFDFVLNKLEYDGDLKYLNVKNSKGRIVLNTTKCDVEVDYDKLDGILEVNTFNSVARVSISKETEYKTILKGIKNEFVDAINTEGANNIIELNGMNSKLIIINRS